MSKLSPSRSKPNIIIVKNELLIKADPGFYPHHDYLVNLQNNKEVLTKLKRLLILNGLKRGDVIELEYFSNSDYQDYIFFNNGLEFIPTSSDIDEHGSVPSEFKVITEFPLSYWYGIMMYNSIVHIDKDVFSKQFDIDNIYTVSNIYNDSEYERDVYVLHLHYNNQTYYIMGRALVEWCSDKSINVVQNYTRKDFFNEVLTCSHFMFVCDEDVIPDGYDAHYVLVVPSFDLY